MSPRGRKEAFLPIEKPAPPRPRRPESSSSLRTSSGLHLAVGLLQRRVAAVALVAGDRAQRRVLGVLEQDARLRHRRPPGRRVARQRPLLQRLLGQHLLAGQQLLDRGRRLGRLQRAEVALVDRGHRRDVAGAEALEAGDEEVLVARGGGLEGVEQLVAAAHPAADVGADRDLVGADRLGVQQVVEAGDRLQVGGRDPHHRGGLADPLRRAPAVAPLHRPERRDRGRVAVRVARHQRPRSARAAPAGSRLRAAPGSPSGLRSGTRPSVTARSTGRSGCDAGAVDGAHRSTPPRIGSSMPRLQIMSAT